MVQVLTMPMMGNTMEIGVVVEWVVDEGESVSEGEVVVVVESEKASNEIAANQDGELASIEVAENEEVPPGTQLGVIVGPDEDAADVDAGIDVEDAEPTANAKPADCATEIEVTTESPPAPDATESTSDVGPRPPAAPGARKRARESDVSLASVEGTGPDGAVLIADMEDHFEATESEPKSEPVADVVASPHVRRLARELDVDLAAVDSHAEGTRVTESDVRRMAAGGRSKTSETGGMKAPAVESEAVDPTSEGLTVAEQRHLSGMRSTIARRMSQSAREKPHVTLNRRVSAEQALSVVDEYRDVDDSLGLNDILVAAAVEALERHPEFNAWFDDGTLSLIEEVNVGVAVDIGDGLVTPVLRDAAEKTPTRLARERAELTERVQEGKHSLDDIQGGTFTITNLGMFGVDSFDPIINPPQIAILGVGCIRDDDDPELTLSLSFDHRVVDGADAARFLDTLAEGFTSPTALLNRRFEAALE